MKRDIRKIFIANRGEICRRVAMTAKRMGIQTSCVSDGKAPPSFLLSVIDHFVFVEEETVSLYLDAAKMIQFAKDAGADAIHPGYGFLSENEKFAQKVIDAKLIWLGPSPKAIEAMAHKSDARQLAIKLGVPCIEGLSVPPDVKEAKLVELAKKVGYPILLKAAKGGGGKGMRVAESSSELWEKTQQAFSEAKNYFGDGTLLLERYVSQSRHIEVQILGDLHGNVVTLGDRDCSLQRRYQKIVEEAPALGLTQKTREELYKHALRLSKDVAYSSCGTIEFLLDWSEASRKKDLQDFFFLEMNTRLQVEHPVTECVFGLDLVEWQIRVGRGEVIPEHFKTLTPRGHALEARIYAEDPSKNFFPSPGKVFCFLPGQGPGVRWDIGIDTVDEISTKFDPMIAKLVVSGESREAANERMVEALRQTFFAGPVNNVSFLQNVFENIDFKKGPIDTHFLKSFKESAKKSDEIGQELLDGLQNSGGSFQQHAAHEGQDLNKKTLSIFSTGAGKSSPETTRGQDSLSVRFEVSRNFSPDSPIKIVYGHAVKRGSKFTPFYYASVRHGDAKRFFVKVGDQVYQREFEKKRIAQSSGVARAQNQILSPVPGRVLKVLVREEDKVEAQQSLFILDSMKMEFVISSQSSGIVHALKVREGDQVESGQLLADFKAQ